MSTITIIEGNNNDKDNTRALMVKGEKGYSAYDIYVQHGGTLTEEEWLDAFLNADNFYNKSETDDLLGGKADKATTLAGYGITDAYTKTETDNLVAGTVTDSYSTSTTKAYSANYINNLVQPDIIFCDMTQNMNFNETDYTDINVWSQITNIGNNLSVSNGKITIGTGINHVKITAKLWLAGTTGTTTYAHIRKNNTDIDGGWSSASKPANDTITVYTQAIVSVASGDILTISIYGNVTVNSNSNIIIEKID